MNIDDVTLPSPSSSATCNTSSSLIARVQSHEPTAWRQLTDLYGPLIYDWARRANLQAQDAADIVQETFAAVFGSIERFRHDRPGDSFLAWLRTIAHNKIHDRFRQLRDGAQPLGGTGGQNRLAQVPEMPPASGDSAEAGATSARPAGIDCGHAPELFAGQSVLHRAVQLIQASVEPVTWQAFWLAAAESIPASDVAQRLGISVQSVYDAKYRVRKRIRDQVEDLLE